MLEIIQSFYLISKLW